MEVPVSTFIVHLSDLHLGGDAADQGKPDLCSWWYYLKQFAWNGHLEPQKHDLNILKNLDANVQTELLNLRKQPNADHSTPAIYVVTGDIGTYQAEKNIINKFHHGYLTSVVPYGPSQFQRMGLNIPVDKLVFIPGNHERFQNITLESFVASKFGKSRENRYKAIGKFDYLYWLPGKKNIFFCCLDTGLTEDLGNFGQGNILAQQREWIHTTVDTLSRNGGEIQHRKVSADEFNSALKVLVTHHCVAPNSRHFFRGHGITRRWLRVKNRHFLDDCFCHFDLVIFGHIHVGHMWKKDKTTYVSASTVSEMTDKQGRNGFSIYAVHQDGSLTTNEYLWRAHQFERSGIAQNATEW